MYIDAFTIAAIVVFVIALAMFIKGCVMKDCGPGYRDINDFDNDERHYKI